MRTTLNKLAAALLLGFLAISPLKAQNTPSVEAETNVAAKSSPEIEKEKLQLDKELARDRLNAEKEMAANKNDAQRMMVHDIAWNSWVIFVIAIFFFGYLRDKRRHETIRLMVEKGTPLTPELLEGLRKKRSNRASYDQRGYLCWGVTEILVGGALIVVFHGGARMAGWIVLAVGIANLILWFIDKKYSNGGQSK